MCRSTAVKYEVRVAGSGDVVASSTAEGDVVEVASGKPLKAFGVALKTMQQGEKATLKIKPECEPHTSSLPFHSLQLSLDSWHARHPSIERTWQGSHLQR